MNKGTVKFYNESKGFGFIVDDESKTEYFVHVTGLTTGVYILKWTEKEKLKSHSYRICVN